MNALGLTVILGVALAPAMLACRSNSQSLAGAEPIALASRRAGDPELARSLELLAPHMNSAGSTRSAEFDLRNASTSELHVYYSLEWFDARVVRIDSTPQLWFPADLDPGESLHVRANAPDPRAESFRLIAQLPDALVQ